MKTADIDIEDMAVAGNVVLKRTARVTVEYGAEDQVLEHSARKLAIDKRSDELTQQKAEEKASSSGAGVMALPVTAINGAPKAYGRAGSVGGRTSTDLADTDGSHSRDSYSDGSIDGSTSTDRSHNVSDNTSASLKSRKLEALQQQDGRPLNFGEVLPGVYRGSFPRTEDYPFYQKLGLRTVVTLVQKDFPAEYKPFLDENGIEHHVFDMEGTKKQTIPIQTMTAILRLVLDPRNYPLLLHCNHGRHRTGCVVAAIRKYYRWNLDCVLDEYRTYAEPKVRDCDLEYISSFDHLQLADLWGKDYHRRADEPPPRRPLIRRDERASFQYRFRRFYRTALFTLAMVLVWIYSGNSMILANSAAGPRPTG